MSHKDKHAPLTRKEKRKAAITARNKRDSLVNDQAALHEQSEQSEREREDALNAQRAKASRASTDEAGHVVWSAKLQEVRNKLTGKKTMAKERWNRFAGTSGGGGRGL